MNSHNILKWKDQSPQRYQWNNSDTKMSRKVLCAGDEINMLFNLTVSLSPCVFSPADFWSIPVAHGAVLHLWSVGSLRWSTVARDGGQLISPSIGSENNHVINPMNFHDSVSSGEGKKTLKTQSLTACEEQDPWCRSDDGSAQFTYPLS